MDISKKQMIAVASYAALAFVFISIGHTSHLIAEPMNRSGQAPPNIILIMADDICFDNYGCYGSDHFQTPRLDELASTGVKFNQCYSQPVCTASRVQIMTGRTNARNYVAFGVLDPSEKTFGTMMQDAGYATAIAGKWQLQGYPTIPGVLPADCGFDTWCMWNYPGGGRNRFWNPSLIRNDELVPVDENSYGPDICTDFLIDFIREEKDGPFFVYYPMILVHSPFIPTPDSVDRNERDAKKNYRDMVAYMDKCIGRIVDTLDAEGLRENTIVIYTSDNGTGRGMLYPFKDEIREGEKAYPTDGGCHAPLIVNCPGVVSEGEENDDLIDFADVMPTLAEIGSVQLPDVQLDGRSFWPQCRGLSGDPRTELFHYYYPKFGPAAERFGGGTPQILWVHDQRYKLYEDRAFYDMVEDRLELDPIAPGEGSPDEERIRRRFQATLDTSPQDGAMLSDDLRRRLDQARAVQD
jgi:arylsulfatase A